MDFDELYSIVRREAEIRGLAHKKMPKISGAVQGFELSNGKTSIYGNILSSIGSAIQKQTISDSLRDFYESHETNSFFIHIDTVGNHFVVIPYKILRGCICQKGARKGWSLSIRRFGTKYSLIKCEGQDVDLSQYVDDLDLLFENLAQEGIQRLSDHP